MVLKYLVEFISTLLFVYVLLSTNNALIIGSIFTFIIFLSKTDGYMNPAITIMMSSFGKIKIDDILPYCLSQIVGSILALYIYKKYK